MSITQIEKLFNVPHDVAGLIGISSVVLISLIAYLVLKKILITGIAKVIKKTVFQWDDIILRRRVFHRLFMIIPMMILFLLSPYLGKYADLFQKLIYSVIVIIGVFTVEAFLSATIDIYNTFKISKGRPIKGYVEVFKIILFIMATIFVISIILDKSPTLLLSGLGAMTAILLLIFKDTILSFAASLQISFNKMIEMGDWIEIPSLNVDGEVIDIALHQIKVQNWDKTITTIPTNQLVSSTFKNWRGMQESGGRRIKRSIYIDQTSIKFCDNEYLNKLKKFILLKDYLLEKEVEILDFNSKLHLKSNNNINGRHLTNIGIFRKYIQFYLKNNNNIHTDFTFLVRQLQPGPEGLPIEIYVFTNNNVWVNYEAIQADIFDHLLAAVSEFDLRVFQHPTGYDYRQRKF